MRRRVGPEQNRRQKLSSLLYSLSNPLKSYRAPFSAGAGGHRVADCFRRAPIGEAATSFQELDADEDPWVPRSVVLVREGYDGRIQSTTKAFMFVGSYYKVSRRIDKEPTKTMIVVVDGTLGKHSRS